MKASEWRPKLTAWLAKNIEVDSWALDKPELVGETMGFLPPLRDVSYQLVNFNECHMTATQDFYVLKRLPAEFTYKQLPVEVLEGVYTTLAIRLVQGYANIDPDVLELELAAVDRPIKVTELGEEVGDWLVEMLWSFTITANVEPEDGAILKPFQANILTLNVYRDSLLDDTTDGVSDPSQRVLDNKIVVVKD